MIKRLFFILISILVTSCGSSKKVRSQSPKKNTPTTSHSSNKATDIIKTALSYKGTKYKFGGTTKSGMDCSGLTYVAFKKHQITLPRISYQQATRGKKIATSSVKKGDLLFFKTNKRKTRINHVGLVIEAKNGTVKFIHSTTSGGVLVSTLDERYWKNAFVQARRVL